MSRKELIEHTILHYPICEYYFGNADEIIYSEKAWEICKQDCERYGHCWTCPPYCGTIGEMIAETRQYPYFCLFSTVTQTPDAWDKEANLKVKHQHDEITRRIQSDLKNEFSDFCILSTGCTECPTCTCPDAPCRFPEKRFFSMESHGVIVMEMLDQAGICYNYGDDTIVYFSMILFHETREAGESFCAGDQIGRRIYGCQNQ